MFQLFVNSHHQGLPLHKGGYVVLTHTVISGKWQVAHYKKLNIYLPFTNYNSMF